MPNRAAFVQTVRRRLTGDFDGIGDSGRIDPVFYDSNHISIEDDTDVCFSEDVPARFAAYGWHVQSVDWTLTGRYVEDVDALRAAVDAARQEARRPSLIMLRTLIGWPAPTKQNSGKAHGSALGEDEIAATKTLLGFDPAEHFTVEEDVLAHTREAAARDSIHDSCQAPRPGGHQQSSAPTEGGTGDRP